MYSIVEKILTGYIKAKQEVFAGNPMGTFFRNDIPNRIYNTGLVNKDTHLITGSVGQGQWATVPWVCIFDRNITTSATKGVYVVYLLAKDGKTLYLTFNQGCTDLRKNNSKAGTIRIMRQRAAEIAGRIDSRGFRTDEDINLGDGLTELAELYQKGTIFYKAYHKDSIPSNDVLLNDLKNMMDIYKEYAETIYNKNDLKAEFLRFLGPVDSLNGYQKSYKLVLYKVMLDLMDTEGKCYSVDVANKFRQFYIDRVNAGKVADINVDKRIENIKDSDYKDIYAVIIANPFRVISEKGFMDKSEESFELEQICFNKQLIAQLTEEDIINIKDIVNKKIDLYFSKIDADIWWPSLNEYDPGISKEQWYKILTETNVFGENAIAMFAGMHALGGAATCATLSAEYGKPISHYIMTAVHAAERTYKHTNCPAPPVEKNSKWWPVLFLGKQSEANEPGDYTWKIRPELFEALTEFGIENYLGGGEMTTKNKIEAIKRYIAERGFNYEGNLIENFYLSLKSKPFVILAGTSGTGKTRLVKLFAEAINAKMKLVPVRPDWSDSSDLFGHTSLSGEFQPGAIIDFIKQAEVDIETPYFLCLDEMNLARVEYYLSDFLSVIETRDRTETGTIESDPLVDVEYYKDEYAAKKYGRVFLPENLYIVGTVNMDETTFPFSKKVLDRANTIEFSFVNLMSMPKISFAEPKKLEEKNDFLKTEYLYLRDCTDVDFIESVCFELEEMNSILAKANLHVGYRVRDEISFYMMNNKIANLLDESAAFDNEIMQKILPRIQGSSRAIKDVLSEMFIKCAGDYSGITGGSTDFEQMHMYMDSGKECKYPNSAKKIAFMMRRYEEDGFTSYWL